jgi:hypothetical protein
LFQQTQKLIIISGIGKSHYEVIKIGRHELISRGLNIILSDFALIFKADYKN